MSAESRRNNPGFNRLAAAASVATLALSANAALETQTAQADTTGDSTAQCMTDGLYSLTGGEMSFDPTGDNALMEVSASALPADCNGQVWRTVSVQQLSGAEGQALTPNTDSQDVYDGNDAFDETMTAPMYVPYACGTEYQQETTFGVTAVNSASGIAPETKTYLSAPVNESCPPATGTGTTTTTTTTTTTGSGTGSGSAPQPSTAQEVQTCEKDAVDSVRYMSMKYLKPTHHKYKRVRQIVKAKALPKACDTLVSREIQVQARLGRPGHIKADSRLEVLDTSDSSIYEYVNQVLRHAWEKGDKTQQQVKVTSVPTKAYSGYGVKPMTRQYRTKAV